MNDTIIEIGKLIFQLLAVPLFFYWLGKRRQTAEVREIESKSELSLSSASKINVEDALRISENWKSLAEFRQTQLNTIEAALNSLRADCNRQNTLLSNTQELNDKLVIRVQMLEAASRDKEKLEIRFARLEKYTRSLFDAFNFLAEFVAQNNPEIFEQAKAKIIDYEIG
jgi:DNA repair ATPase RecN